MKRISVRLDDGLHAKVRIRAFGEGVSLDGLARGWFERYADGMLAAGEDQRPGERAGQAVGSLPRLRESTPGRPPAASVPDYGLSAGDRATDGTDSGTPDVRQRGTAVPDPTSPAERPYRPDWKKGSKK